MSQSEYDLSAFATPTVGDLAYVTDITDGLSKFGFSVGEKVNRRELCTIYSQIKSDMKDEIYRLARSNGYESAKKMEQKLKKISQAFKDVQTSELNEVHQKEVGNFLIADSELKDQLSQSVKASKDEMISSCVDFEKKLKLQHKIEQENLEYELSRMKIPVTKYSKRIIELLKAESELIKLAQYEDARKVRRMLSSLITKEEETHTEKFFSDLHQKRLNLNECQKVDSNKLEEKLKALEWTNNRKCGNTKNTFKQRLVNHQKDMTHSHVQEKKTKPEMNVNPSALWIRRRGYQDTAASLRGTQLLQSAKYNRSAKVGGPQPRSIPTVDLTSRHDFDY
jgi:hypothetical protein